MKHKLLIGAAGFLIFGGIAASGVLTPQGVTLDTATAKKVVWDKPTTDAQWAEDVKKENLNIKSTGVLEKMIETHTAKLEREKTNVDKYAEMEAAGQDPVQYLYWGWLENLRATYPDLSNNELEAEALKQAQEQYAREAWSIEKLQQSIERMNKEVELRKKGFLVVEGETTLLGASVPPERIRHIND